MSTPQAFAHQTPTKAAVIMGDVTMTYAQLNAGSVAIARWFRSQGLGVGDVVAVLMENQPTAFCVFWATQRSGLYLTPIGTKLTASEIGYILEDCGAKILVASPKLAMLARDALALCALSSRPAFVIQSEQVGELFPQLQADVGDDQNSGHVETEGGDMLYTSGTTGRPKGVKRPLSGKAFGADTSRSDRSRDLFKMDQNTVFLSPAPLYHAAPLRFCMSVHRLGGTVVLMSGFDGALAWSLLHKHDVTHSQWAPTMLNRLLATKSSLSPSHLPRQHKVAIHAGAPCPLGVKRAMIEWWGPILHEYYSGTESIGFTHIDSHDWLIHQGSVGQAIGCKVHIVEPETKTVLAPHLRGLVYFEGKAPLVYHNSAEKTAGATHSNGWATMGDIGYVNEDGFLFLTDRAAFTIISGGVNIYPKEVEDALLEHDGVEDAAVFGTPDSDLGEMVVAALVVAPQVKPNSDSAIAICADLRTRLSAIKMPRRIIFYDQLPRSEAGKLLKRDLQTDFVGARADQSFPAREGAPA